jgi:hypothetical protein
MRTPVSVMPFLPYYECSRAAERILDAMLFTRVWNANTRHARNADIFELFILDLPRVYLVVY